MHDFVSDANDFLRDQKGVNRLNSIFFRQSCKTLRGLRTAQIFIELAGYIRKMHLHVFYYSLIVFIVSTSVTVFTCVLSPYTPIIHYLSLTATKLEGILQCPIMAVCTFF